MSSQLGQAEPRLLSDVSTLHCNIDGLSIKTAAKNQHWHRPAYCPDAWPLPSPRCQEQHCHDSQYGRDHELILSSSPAPDKLQDILIYFISMLIWETKTNSTLKLSFLQMTTQVYKIKMQEKLFPDQNHLLNENSFL